MTDVLTLGEAMGCLRGEGRVQLGGTMALGVAGAESNVAIGLSRLGHSSSWVGVVGPDQIGELVVRTLRAEGVDVSSIRRGDEPTGIVVFENRVAGVARVDYHRRGSAGSTVSGDDVAVAFAQGSPRIVHLTGVTLALSETAADAVRTAARLARECGAVVSLDVNHRSRLWSADTARTALSSVIDLVDVVIASEDELGLVAPSGTIAEQAGQLLAAGARAVVVKQGSDGATSYTADGVVRSPARRVRAVDVIGAGDAFVAGYLSGLLDGLPEPDRLQRANTVGAFAVASRGDWEGLPTREELALLDVTPGEVVR
ncbi:sugar kinase [Mumia zhuanghuii]|uniref:Sugar kinase n=2 Tax=Mumia TaxID=1546255 RepID=A0ABW1QKJ4_9ACTN|nr:MULTISPECIES: sugar kinase [Mumia]KAA1418294.1 sugar kinase [Mumia zhuanghuii]